LLYPSRLEEEGGGEGIMPTIQVYLQEDVHKQLTESVPPGKRSPLINKLLKEYFARKKKNKKVEK